MRVYGFQDFVMRRFKRPGDPRFRNQVRRFRANNMRPEQLVALRVKDHLHHALALPHSQRFAARREGKTAHANFVAGLARGVFGQSDTGDLRLAIGAAGDIVAIDAEGERVPVPPLVIETEAQEQVCRDAQARREQRLKRKAAAKSPSA